MNALAKSVITLMAFSLTACATGPFPSSAMKDVDPKVDFGVLKAQPDVYKGRAVQLAGRIVDVEPVEGGTLIVARSLPVRGNQPVESITEPERPTGKFAFLYPGKIPPADLQFGNEFLVVAQMQGEKTRREPYLVARCVHVWRTGPLDEISDFPDWLDTYYPLEEQTYCSKS
jgi:starvation-inducible outer membrane lipoprotein